MLNRTAAVIATGWLGDSIACTAAATSLHEKGFQVDFYTRWPQLAAVLSHDPRFRTIVYGRMFFKLRSATFLTDRYHLIVKEPTPWSYDEPFTSEIRRIAGCNPLPEYQIPIPASIPERLRAANDRPLIAMSRDIHKRAFGRDIQELVQLLETQADITWVGLDPEKSSKAGKRQDLTQAVAAISSADLFVGPEGGLLWLAAGLAKQCVYFTENIQHVQSRIVSGNAAKALGPYNCFPDAGHIALPAGCGNLEAVERIHALLKASRHS